MSQQINLLNPALIQKTDFLNPNNIGLVLGFLCVGLLAFYQFEQTNLTKLTQKRDYLASQVTELETQVLQMRTARLAQTSNGALLETIKQLEQKTIMQEEIIKAVSHHSAQSNHPYAALLKAFSKQSIDGLWITGLSIDQDAEALSIKGRALHADLLPAFIARLRAEPALKGKTFTDLKMQNTASTQSSHDQSTVTDAMRANAQNTDSANVVTKVSVNPAIAKTNTPAYIEFTLHSVTEKNKTAENRTPVGASH